MGSSQRVSPARLNRSQLVSPCPTKYVLDSVSALTQSLTQAPKISFGLKLPSPVNKSKALVPGPGNYSPLPQKRDAQFSFGKRLGKGFTQTATPGPGAYDFIATRVRGAAITKDKRIGDIMNKTQIIVPGPGQYEKEVDSLSRNSRPKFGFGHSQRASTAHINKRFQNPGPGTYD